MTRRTALPAVALLLAAATACGQTTARPRAFYLPAVTTSPPGPATSSATAVQRAAEVARAWPGSAEEKAWRTGYYPLGTAQEWLPKDAFHSGDDKFGFLSGHLDLKVPLPTAGPTARVVWQGGAALTLPLLPAGDVLKGLTEGKPPCTGHCDARLAITAVTAGTRAVETSRGQATVPVWEFTIAGYAEPFAYPAVAPQQALRPVPPPTPYPEIPGASSAGWSGTSADGLTLTGTVGHGSCATARPGEVYETDSVVVLIGHTESTKQPGTPCTAMAVASEVPFHLARPLGGRVVLDLYSGAPQAQHYRPGRERPQGGDGGQHAQ